MDHTLTLGANTLGANKRFVEDTVTTLESTKWGMFKNENPTLENKQIEVGHDKNQESMLRTSSKKREKIEKKNKKRRRNFNYTMSVGIFGQTSCGKKCY